MRYDERKGGIQIPMKNTNMPYGKVCGMVVFQQNEPLSATDKCLLVQNMHRALTLGLQKQCSTFVMAIHTESNLFCAQYLLHMRKKLSRLSVFVLVPENEKQWPRNIKQRNAMTICQNKADGILQNELPVHDFAPAIALHSDELIVYALSDCPAFQEFQEDIEDIDFDCDIDILS